MNPLLAVLVLVLAAVGLFTGPVALSELGWDGVLALRGWRVLAAALAGACLAVGCCLVQALFRNPLAEPGLIGVGAGANLGGMAALALSATLPWLPAEALIPVLAVAGGLGALLILAAVARRVVDGATVLLAGIVLSLLLSSVATLLTSLVMDDWGLARAMLAFGLGGVDGAGMIHLAIAAPLATAGLWGAWRARTACDLLLSGDEEATTLGLDVPRRRRWLLTWTALLVAAAAAVGGAVAFVGLIVPHLLRRRLGPGHARLLPAAALGGAACVLACDALVRAVPTNGALPLGVVTGLVGAPLFAAILLRRQP
jgi:iron complex transport system permease protein